ncbi:MAG: lysophospholipid acyltransferase family protein [Phycisphaerales bacterium]|nr:MAG: lysophospholipid acyltransferase family protein [Phycisphaerales bacterium]
MADGQTPRKRKKKKKHNPVLDWLLYVAVRVLVMFLYLFDVETNLRFACFLGRLLWKHYHRGRQRALDNLRASFPEKSEAWIHQTGRRSFEHVVMLTIDVLFTPRLVKKYNWREYSRYRNAEHAKWLMQERRGLLMVTGHYSNFEIIGYLMGLFGFDLYSIARPLDNKYLNRFLYGVRERRGQKIIDKKGAARLMPRITAQGSTLGFIADQDSGKKGIFVDFFGRQASTYKSIGLVALSYNLPIVIGYSRRVGNRFFFELGVTRIIFPHEWADKDDPLRWVTAEYTEAIETFVREDPTQYWWLHRRWKTRPKEERRRAERAAVLADSKGRAVPVAGLDASGTSVSTTQASC